jgi:ADP-ribose pyrophosphatase YjhB (NUDIX family)/predicted transcriptional regulator
MVQGAAFRILYLFVETDTLGFAEICKNAGYGTDLGGYYLRSLVQDGLLKKIDRGQYNITPAGKHELAITNNGHHTFVLRPRTAVLLVVRKGNRYIVLERTIQPYIGRHEWPVCSILHGEPMVAAAKRTLKLQLGLEGQPQFIGFYRRIDVLGEDTFDDKLFAVHTFELPEDTHIIEQGVTGRLVLATATDLQALSRPAKSLLDIFTYAEDASRPPYTERVYALSDADLAAPES